MTRDPFTGEQIRFLRSEYRPVPFSGPFNAPAPTNRGDFWVGVAAGILAILVATSELLGWPIP